MPRGGLPEPVIVCAHGEGGHDDRWSLTQESQEENILHLSSLSWHEFCRNALSSSGRLTILGVLSKGRAEIIKAGKRRALWLFPIFPFCAR